MKLTEKLNNILEEKIVFKKNVKTGGYEVSFNGVKITVDKLLGKWIVHADTMKYDMVLNMDSESAIKWDSLRDAKSYINDLIKSGQLK